MSQYQATVRWDRRGEVFIDNKYSRAHAWQFDGGAVVPASSSPHVVRVPLSDPAGVDPEEAFIASLASCHMLWFLSLAAKRGYVVDRYTDDAIGELDKDPEGRIAMTVVTLRPRVVFSGEKQPNPDQVADLHHRSHHECYIANSVKTEVRCQPVGE